MNMCGYFNESTFLNLMPVLLITGYAFIAAFANCSGISTETAEFKMVIAGVILLLTRAGKFWADGF